MLKFLVLREAGRQAGLRAPRPTPPLLDAVRGAGTIDAQAHAALRAAHAPLLDAGLRCTLDRRPRRVPPTVEIDTARASIRAAIDAQELRFAVAGEADAG